MSELIEIRKRLLEANDQRASLIRERFRCRGSLVVNLLSSPGSGKTTLLEETARCLGDRLGLAVLVGDVATERDADRLRAVGLPAHQIVTGGACHLDAELVQRGLSDAGNFPGAEILFLENVGNLVCPASYDLGEDSRVVLLSTTEGDDKALKYPAIFSRADLCLITKSDLLPHLDFDVEAARSRVLSLNPKCRVLLLSARSGEGMKQWIAILEDLLAAKRMVPA